MLAIEGPGSSFAELPVFDGGSYPAAASASEDAELLFISRKDFQDFCREHPEVALKVLAVVGTRLRLCIDSSGSVRATFGWPYLQTSESRLPSIQ